MFVQHEISRQDVFANGEQVDEKFQLLTTNLTFSDKFTNDASGTVVSPEISKCVKSYDPV